MENEFSIWHRLKPGIPKRVLLFMAGGVWIFAGGFLLWRGWNMISHIYEKPFITLLICAALGGLFYYILFDKISSAHTNRIKSLPQSHPCAFSFFNWRSYMMMALMITTGIILRKVGLVPTKYMAPFFIVMGTPLVISAIRFYKNGIYYKGNQNQSK